MGLGEIPVHVRILRGIDGLEDLERGQDQAYAGGRAVQRRPAGAQLQVEHRPFPGGREAACRAGQPSSESAEVPLGRPRVAQGRPGQPAAEQCVGEGERAAVARHDPRVDPVGGDEVPHPFVAEAPVVEGDRDLGRVRVVLLDPLEEMERLVARSRLHQGDRVGEQRTSPGPVRGAGGYTGDPEKNDSDDRESHVRYAGPSPVWPRGQPPETPVSEVG